MKDTGIKWINFISDDWGLRRVKHCFFISKEPANQKDPTVLSLARSGVKIRDITNNEGQLAASYDNYNVVRYGDLLLNPMDLYSGANCNMSEVEGVISPAYINLRKTDDVNTKFYDFYFKTQYWTMAMFAHGKGVSFDNRWTLNADAILNYYIPLPSKAVQNKIVSYLKEKTCNIEKLIEIENAQIDSMKKYKNSIICNSLFGVNSFREYLESDFPKIKLKYLIKFINGYAFNSEDFNNSGSYNVIRIGDINEEGIDFNNCAKVYCKIDEQFKIRNKDVLIAMSGATIGKMAISKHDSNSFINQRVGIMRGFEPKMTFYSLSNDIFKEYINYMNLSSAQPNISAGQILNFGISIKENVENTLLYLEEKCREIDMLISVKRMKVGKLEEYRRSIIYEYVTGKKEVAA